MYKCKMNINVKMRNYVAMFLMSVVIFKGSTPIIRNFYGIHIYDEYFYTTTFRNEKQILRPHAISQKHDKYPREIYVRSFRRWLGQRPDETIY